MTIKIFPSSITEVFMLELPFLNSVASFGFSVCQLCIPFVILFEEEFVSESQCQVIILALGACVLLLPPPWRF